LQCQRLAESFDGFLPFLQVSLGGFLKFPKNLFRQPAKIRAVAWGVA